MIDIIVIGSGGHASVVIDIIEQLENFRIVGLIDRFNSKEYSLGYEVLKCIPTTIKYGILAIGDNFIRYKESQIYGDLDFITVIHPSAIISQRSKLGLGSVVMAGAIVNSNTVIGNHSIVNTGSTLDHDNVLGDFSSVAPGVTTGGNVRIGDFSHIGLGAKIKQGCHIGENSIIGLNSGVLSSIPSSTVAFGTPCKVKRIRNLGEKYL